MILDEFDERVMKETGLAQDILKRVYGINISQNSAKKYIAGVRKHILHKSRMLGIERNVSDMEEVVIKADGSRTTTRMVMLSEEDQKDPSRLMTIMGYDCLQWTLISCKSRRNYWDTSIKNGDGEAEKSTNHAFMVTLTVKPAQQMITMEIVKQALAELKPVKLERITHKGGDLMLELPIVDLHLGLLSWGDETGEDYDLKIAERLYKDTILDIIARVEAYGLKIEKVLFPIGQDFFNSDTVTNTTTKGTMQDSDIRWPKMYLKGVELMAWSIEQLRRIAPVHVLHVKGNHDKMLGYFAVITMKSHFRSVDDVLVDISPKPRMYVQYGTCLIGYAHGEDEGKRIHNLMQIEAPVMWGKTRWREMHMGHLHKEGVTEEGGVIYRRISTIKANSAWEVEMGYIGAVHKASAFVWHKERGKELTIDVTVKESE